MKRLLACLLYVGLLCGCSEKTKNPSEFSGESVADIVEQTEPEETSLSEETTSSLESETDTYEEYDVPLMLPVGENADPFEVAERYTFEVAEEGVWVYCGGERVQLLDADTAELLRVDDPEEHLTHEDFDFDLYTDLFVPEMLYRPNMPGKYFRFDTKTGLFVRWEEMNEIGYRAITNDTDGTLSFILNSGAVYHKTTVYEWQNEALVKVRYEVQYEGNDGEVYIDSYNCADGNEELLYRERVLISENGEWLGTEEVPIGDITNTQEQE